MKKLFLTLCAAVLCISANAFEFDGIDLNAPLTQITREIAKKGYVFDDEKQALTGLCQGTQIYLTINSENVTEKGHISQLIVEVPAANQAFFSNCAMLLNVIYHQTYNDGGNYNYNVDKDGTTLIMSKTQQGIRLTYNTPYSKK